MVSDHPSTVSVVIPCFNQGRFLAGAIESALAQEGVQVQLLVINDGSTDETRDVAARFAHRVVVIDQSNQGLAAARNVGLALATGEYAALLDADDRLEPAFAARMITACREHECDFAYCDFHRMDPVGNIIATERLTGSKVARNLASGLMHGGLFPPVCVLGRRAAFEPLPLGMDGHADYALWLKLSLAGRCFVHVPEALVRYCDHPASMSRDALHMELSWQAALAEAARCHPHEFFAAVQGLQKEFNALLHLTRYAPPLNRGAWNTRLRRVWRKLGRFWARP